MQSSTMDYPQLVLKSVVAARSEPRRVDKIANHTSGPPAVMAEHAQVCPDGLQAQRIDRSLQGRPHPRRREGRAATILGILKDKHDILSNNKALSRSRKTVSRRHLRRRVPKRLLIPAGASRERKG